MGPSRYWLLRWGWHLFFAGEATDTSGNNGTVHGAIASAYSAAAEIMHPPVACPVPADNFS